MDKYYLGRAKVVVRGFFGTVAVTERQMVVEAWNKYSRSTPENK
jgi:hypothetical protein